jgi:hypothetical protein
MLQNMHHLDLVHGVIGPWPWEAFQVVKDIRIPLLVNIHVTNKMVFSAAEIEFHDLHPRAG